MDISQLGLGPERAIWSDRTGRTYILAAKKGEGGFGAVHECFDARSFENFVAKFAKPSPNIGQTELRWQQECEFMLAVDSPHIIRLHDYFLFQGAFWMIMERAECSLREWITNRGNLTEQESVVAGVHMLRALKELNAKNIVHRDLHIDNILWVMVNGIGKLKIADFGIAKQVGFRGGIATTKIGRVYDISPELHLLGYTTHQSDLYQIGLAMYFVSQGVEALSNSDGEPRDAILSGVARKRAEALGTPLGNFIAVLLRRSLEHRFQSAEGALEALRPVAKRYRVKF